MLIRCVAYQQGRMLAEIKPQEIARYLAIPDCFVWVALFGYLLSVGRRLTKVQGEVQRLESDIAKGTRT